METTNTTIRTAVPERRPQPALRATTPALNNAPVACVAKPSNRVNPFVAWGVILLALAGAAAYAAIAWKDLFAVL